MTERNKFISKKQAEESRRGFLKTVTGVLGSLLGLIVAIPFLDALGIGGKKGAGHFARVASVHSLPSGNPKDVSFQDMSQDAYIRQMVTRDVWTIKHSEQDVTVFSPICPHLGCRYNWHADKNEFICPCHGSVFNKEGKVLAGPAPRPLDTLPKHIVNGDLEVKWERFQVGIPQKKVVS